MDWRDFFRVTYHPDPGHWYIHWAHTHIPIDSPFLNYDDAETWLSQNYRYMLDCAFEKAILLDK